MVFSRNMFTNITFLTAWFFILFFVNNNVVCIYHQSNRTTSYAQPQYHTKYIYLLQTSSTYSTGMLFLWKHVTNSTGKRNLGSLLNTQTCWKWHTHTHTHTTCHDLPSRSSFTSLAAFSPSSRRFLSIIFDLSAAALSSALTVQPMIEPCARQTSENGSDQLGPFRSRTVNYKDAAWIDRCDIKVQSVTI